MTVTERTLKKWRKEALKDVNAPNWDEANPNYIMERAQRILRMTQELLDQHLINKR